MPAYLSPHCSPDPVSLLTMNLRVSEGFKSSLWILSKSCLFIGVLHRELCDAWYESPSPISNAFISLLDNFLQVWGGFIPMYL